MVGGATGAEARLLAGHFATAAAFCPFLIGKQLPLHRAMSVSWPRRRLLQPCCIRAMHRACRKEYTTRTTRYTSQLLTKGEPWLFFMQFKFMVCSERESENREGGVGGTPSSRDHTHCNASATFTQPRRRTSAGEHSRRIFSGSSLVHSAVCAKDSRQRLLCRLPTSYFPIDLMMFLRAGISGVWHC